MFKSSVFAFIARFPTSVWWLAAIVLVAVSQYAQFEMGEFYKLSQFPVSFFVGQTAFDAVKIKIWYAFLVDRGTLITYVWVQIADFGYMLTVFVAFFALMAAVSRSLPHLSWAQKIARSMLFVAPLAAVFDALENLVSFVMLADPVNFADWLVYPYSTFASIKFGIYGLTYLWTVIGAAIALLAATYARFSRRVVEPV